MGITPQMIKKLVKQLILLVQSNTTPMVALVDCNNFYVSCERVFNPSLEARPVMVLSNNDGCAVARCNVVKSLGVRMGQPVHIPLKLNRLFRGK